MELGDLQKIGEAFNKKAVHVSKRRKELEKKIDKAQEELKKLHYPYWTEEMAKPLGTALATCFPEYELEFWGPHGLGPEFTIALIRKGVDEDHKLEGSNCISFSVRPRHRDDGGMNLELVDHRVNTGKYPKESIGDVNGLNHPGIPMVWEEEWVLQKIRELNGMEGSS